jgi:hypothetical protein
MVLLSKTRESLEYRVSVVERALAMELGRLARKVPRQLIVRGIWEELF